MPLGTAWHARRSLLRNKCSAALRLDQWCATRGSWPFLSGPWILSIPNTFILCFRKLCKHNCSISSTRSVGRKSHPHLGRLAFIWWWLPCTPPTQARFLRSQSSVPGPMNLHGRKVQCSHPLGCRFHMMSTAQVLTPRQRYPERPDCVTASQAAILLLR
jgi:hypothetical protein